MIDQKNAACAMSHCSRCCNHLLCLSCNIDVVMFDNLAWMDEVDYLFLRNNIPDFGKLRTRMRNDRGTRAYACHCQWRSVRDVEEVTRRGRVSWVCKRH